jgi:GT2 family glycosyltransferase
MLIYGKRNYKPVFDYNMSTAGYRITEVTLLNIKGIAFAMNEGLRLAKGYDAVMFLSNDIKEPQGWLSERIRIFNEYPDAGIVSIPFDRPRETVSREYAYGNWLIHRKLIDKIGGFNEKLFPVYGPIDTEYLHRTHLVGLASYFVPNKKTTHIGENQDCIYGYSKLGKIKDVGDAYYVAKDKYTSGELSPYIPFD